MRRHVDLVARLALLALVVLILVGSIGMAATS